jgi:hypothetical protein
MAAKATPEQPAAGQALRPPIQTLEYYNLELRKSGKDIRS